MRCIFCKNDSSSSKKIEHIIPESLGNQEHTLPVGVVCDSCNSYFGIKVEKPLLNSYYFRQARFRNRIPNKENRIPTIQGISLPGIVPIDLMTDEDGKSVFTSRERDTARFIDSLKSVKKGLLIFPVVEKPDEQLMSRFLAKVALEVLASRLLGIPEGLNEVIDKSELDKLRHYARFGASSILWPYNIRVVYPEGKLFVDDGQKYEILHEYNLLYTESKELYSVVVILGVEYVINMGEPSLDGYTEWLEKNNYKSPLYMEGSQLPSDSNLFPNLRPPL